jgi:hypothetical protein
MAWQGDAEAGSSSRSAEDELARWWLWVALGGSGWPLGGFGWLLEQQKPGKKRPPCSLYETTQGISRAARVSVSGSSACRRWYFSDSELVLPAHPAMPIIASAATIVPSLASPGTFSPVSTNLCGRGTQEGSCHLPLGLLERGEPGFYKAGRYVMCDVALLIYRRSS